MESRPRHKSLDKRSSQSMVPPLCRDIDVQMGGIVSAEIANDFEIFNVTEMGEFRWIFEAACEIADGEPEVIKHNKKTVPVSLDISPERSLSKNVLFLFARKKIALRSIEKKFRLFHQCD